MKLLLLFLIYLFTINSFSQQLTVTAGNVSAVSGDSVIVPINVQNFLSVGAITIKIQYTPSVLSWGRALNWDPQLSGALANATNGVVTIAWDAIAGMSINDGKLVDLKFLYNGDSTVMDFLEGQCEIADVNGNIISTTYINGSVNELPSITVTAPPLGATWTVGGSQTVTWSSTNVTGNVNIKLSTDGGVTYPITLADNTANDGTESITVPNNPSTTCRVKVESVNNTSIFGENPGNFTIVEASYITVTSPNGGESWVSGNQYNITWTDNISENVKIELYKGGAFNSTIIASTASDGTHPWTIPLSQLTGSDYRVRITSVNTGTLYDESNSNFTINQPAITVTAPPLGATWTVGGSQTVTWSSTNVTGNVNIKLSTDGGVTYPITLADNTANDGTESITVPNNPSTTCRVKVESVNNTSIFGENPGNFTIVPILIATVTAGNVSAVSGDSVIVPINVQNFLSVGAITIKIQYTPSVLSWGRALNWDPQLSGALANATNGVVTIAWDAIAGMSINDGKLVDLKFLYNGDSTVMDFLEGQCEIADVNGNIISTTYINGSVNELPSITVTKPIYGEIWVSGTADTIRWISSTAITNVKISYKRSTQSTWYTIISSTPNDGSYVWSLPPATGTSLLRIKVESTMDPNVFGISDEFIITEPISSPTNLSGQINYNPLYVELMWNDNSNNEDGFIIERETMLGDSYLVIDSVGPNINTYTDTTISYLTFNYRVKAFNQYINSTYSEPIQIIIPVNLISFIVTPKDHIVEIEWKTATELNNKGFEIERKINQEWEKIFFITGAGTTTEMKRYLFLDRLENSFIKGTVKYKLKQIDYNGLTTNLIEAELIIDFTPKEFSLSQNFPNPFNSTTTIIYSVPTESRVRISLLSILGEEIKVLVDDQVSPGNHKYTYSAYELSTGIYFVKMEAGSFTQYRKIILLK